MWRSIHKAQGQTLPRVKVDLRKVFEKGMRHLFSKPLPIANSRRYIVYRSELCRAQSCSQSGGTSGYRFRCQESHGPSQSRDLEREFPASDLFWSGQLLTMVCTAEISPDALKSFTSLAGALQNCIGIASHSFDRYVAV